MSVGKMLRSPMFGLVAGTAVLLAGWSLMTLVPKRYQIRSEYIPTDETTIYNIYASCGPLGLFWCMDNTASDLERARKIVQELKNPRGETVIDTTK